MFMALITMLAVLVNAGVVDEQRAEPAERQPTQHARAYEGAGVGDVVGARRRRGDLRHVAVVAASSLCTSSTSSRDDSTMSCCHVSTLSVTETP